MTALKVVPVYSLFQQHGEQVALKPNRGGRGMGHDHDRGRYKKLPHGKKAEELFAVQGSYTSSHTSVLVVGRAETQTKMFALTGVERSYASAIGQTMQNLTVQAEVGSAMESMLGDLEAWEWANKEEVLKKELEHARAQIQALKKSEGNLLEVRRQAGRWCRCVVLWDNLFDVRMDACCLCLYITA